MPTPGATRRRTPAGPAQTSGIAPILRRLVGVVLKLEGRRGGEIGVVLANDATLREFNRRWRGIDRATDVISFAYDEHHTERRRPVTGDIVISMDRTRVQARRFRVSVGRELARLVIHGTLHLCGHDHRRPVERRTMRTLERRAMFAASEPVRALERRLESASGP